MHELLPEIESRFREPIECCGNLAALRCPNGFERWLCGQVGSARAGRALHTAGARGAGRHSRCRCSTRCGGRSTPQCSDGALKTRYAWTEWWLLFAVQDEFNGCFAACPDPIDFRACERAQTHRACLCTIKTIDPTCLILRAFIARHLSCCHEPQAPTNTSPR